MTKLNLLCSRQSTAIHGRRPGSGTLSRNGVFDCLLEDPLYNRLE